MKALIMMWCFPCARIEAIRLFFAYASFMNFVVYQMDVKSAFLYGIIKEEVYVSQPPGFMDLESLEKVYKVEMALYGLHQALRAWYETFSTYLLDSGFYKRQIDKTLFIKRVKGDILLIQVYVDDIIFGSTKKFLCTDFEQIMHKRFQMSSMGELTFFLGLQVKQKEDGIFISQDKYVGKILKKFSFSSVRTTSTPMKTNKVLTKDEDGKDVDVHLYRLMIGSLMYLTSSRPDIMFSVYMDPHEFSHVYLVISSVLVMNRGMLLHSYWRTSQYCWTNINTVRLLDCLLPLILLVHNQAPEGEGNRYRWQSQAPRNHGGTPAQTRSKRVLEKPNEPTLSEGHTSRSGKGMMEHQFELTANVPITPHDSPLPGGYTPRNDDGRLKLQELMTM
ncbi:putative ribonuclease H-like domain-containing protein [Tanacetum coccineum]